jgi:hypothetical protein
VVAIQKEEENSPFQPEGWFSQRIFIYFDVTAAGDQEGKDGNSADAVHDGGGETQG